MKFIKTIDGSNTLFSGRYNQHYHNPDDGAINETLTKHIIPAFTFCKNKTELNILDICFGIGYNSFCTIYYVLENNLDIKLNIFSPELDGNLIKSLETFEFPKEFENIKHIIKSITKTCKYEDEKIKIEVFIGDARNYIKTLKNDSFDIIFQDAFSSEVNLELWTKEYFDDIYRLCNNGSIMTSYSVATPIRLSMYEAGFFIYEHRPAKRKITLCFKSTQEVIGKIINMERKKELNKNYSALYDNLAISFT